MSKEVKPNPVKKSNENCSFPLQCIFLLMNGSWPVRLPMFSGRYLQPKSNEISSLGENVKWHHHLYWFWSVFIILLVGITCYFQSAFLNSSLHQIFEATECGCTVLMGIHNLIRLIHLNRNRRHLAHIIMIFVNYIWFPRSKEKELSEKCDKQLIIFRVMAILQLVLIIMYIILPLLQLASNFDAYRDVKPFPYRMIFPYEANYGVVYSITYFATSLAGFSVVTTLIAEDSLFGFFLIYTCGQFKILHRKIQELRVQARQRIKFASSYEDYDRECCNILGSIIVRHNIIIEFSQNLDRFFSPIILINFTISSFLICLVGFQIATVKLSTGDLAKLIVYLISCFSQLLILCWNGDRLIENSLNTSMEFYQCNWETGMDLNTTESNHIGSAERFDKRFRKNLIFAIQRAQNPLKITALKFSIVSLRSFTTILSTSLSYFTLLQSLVEKT